MSILNTTSNERSTLLPSSSSDNPNNDDSIVLTKKKIMKGCAVLLSLIAGVLGCGTLFNKMHNGDNGYNNLNDLSPATATTIYSSQSPNHRPKSKKKKILMPYGVNLGSWLSLEDYFFTGDNGAIQVATPANKTAAICLPPLHTGQLTDWNSETDLLSKLRDQVGLRHALQIIQAHRNTFITVDDLQQLQSWGIRHVRIPLSWCLTDATYETMLLRDNNDDDDDAYLLKHFTCPDPHHKHVIWPAISKPWLAQFLQTCVDYGLSASLDLHTYPGGTSPGTFSGVWPKAPKFWKNDTVGHELLRDFLLWIENDLSPKARKGILGISPMNEPAHLAGMFYNTSQDYLPPLSMEDAAQYLSKIGQFNQAHHSSLENIIPDGPHLRVLSWLDTAMDMFRRSKLPSMGLQLHVNVHESLFRAELLESDDDLDMGGRHPAATKIVAAWWSQVTTQEERSSWAVLDMHHYHAWEPKCQGTVVAEGSSSNYTCNDVTARRDALQRCASWATHVFRKLINEYCGDTGAQLMSGEFSTSTHYRVRHACQSEDALRDSYEYQSEAAREASVNLFYWSYRMPYGGLAKNAWSFQQLMYELGNTNVNEVRPDVSNVPCERTNEEEDDDEIVTDDWLA